MPLSAEDKTLLQTAVEEVVQGTHVDESVSEDFPVAFGAATAVHAGSGDGEGGGDDQAGASAAGVQTEAPVVHLAASDSAVECKVVFFEPDPSHGGQLRLCIAFRSQLPLPLRIADITPTVAIKNPSSPPPSMSASTSAAPRDDSSSSSSSSSATALPQSGQLRITSPHVGTAVLVPGSVKVVELWVGFADDADSNASLASSPSLAALPPAGVIVCRSVRARLPGQNELAVQWCVAHGRGWRRCRCRAVAQSTQTAAKRHLLLLLLLLLLFFCLPACMSHTRIPNAFAAPPPPLFFLCLQGCELHTQSKPLHLTPDSAAIGLCAVESHPTREYHGFCVQAHQRQDFPLSCATRFAAALRVSVCPVSLAVALFVPACAAFSSLLRRPPPPLAQ